MGSLVVHFWSMSLVASETPRGPAAPPLSGHLRSRYPPHPKVTLPDLPAKSTEWLGGSKGRKRSMCTLNSQSLWWIATSLPIVETPARSRHFSQESNWWIYPSKQKKHDAMLGKQCLQAGFFPWRERIGTHSDLLETTEWGEIVH